MDRRTMSSSGVIGILVKTYETHKVETAVTGLGVLERGLDILQLTELVLRGSKIDTDNILEGHNKEVFEGV